jgi:hypothetical protein
MDEVKKQTRRTPAERETEEVAAEARRLFFYHAETGLILRRCYWMGKNVGEEAGTQRTDADGMTYRSVSIKYKIFMSHRVAWLLHYGRWPAMQIDHKDGDGLNNRIGNLSEVTNKQNAMNQKLNAKNSSGVTGVRWHKLAKKWTARIVQDQREIYLGLFESFEDAVRARKDAESKYGFSDRHGTKEATVVAPAASDRIP